MADDAEVEQAIRDALAAAGGRSIDPSEAAQRLAEANWRPLLGRVRRVAIAMAERGALEILRKGRPVAPDEVRGVVRFRLPPG